MIKILLFIILAVLVFLGLLLYIEEETPNYTHPIQESNETIVQQNILNSKQITIKSHSPITQELKTHQNKNISKNHQSIKIYETLSIEEASLNYKPRSYVKPISALRIFKQKFIVGDTLILPNIEGVDYEIVISRINNNNDGSKSITGSYSDEGIPYTTTMTQSTSESFISLATTNGSYEIETQKGIGYIYKTNEIRKAMQPSPINDEIILPSPSTSQTIE